MRTGWSEKIRETAEREYINPARKNRKEIRIRIGELQRKMKAQGFPGGHTNQLLTSLESELFWKPRGLEMTTPVGQPRKHETEISFRFTADPGKHSDEGYVDPLLELAGMLKGAICEGTDAFVRELRRDKAGS